MHTLWNAPWLYCDEWGRTVCKFSGLRRTPNGPSLQSLHGSAAPDQRGSTKVEDCRQTSPTHHNNIRICNGYGIRGHHVITKKSLVKTPYWWHHTERPILDLIWNLSTVNVRHVPELGIIILCSFIKCTRLFKISSVIILVSRFSQCTRWKGHWLV